MNVSSEEENAGGGALGLNENSIDVFWQLDIIFPHKKAQKYIVTNRYCPLKKGHQSPGYSLDWEMVLGLN